MKNINPAQNAVNFAEKMILPVTQLYHMGACPFHQKITVPDAEIVNCILENGVTKPIEVRKHNSDGYEVITGYQYVIAAKEAGLETIPCYIVKMDDDTALLHMLDEYLLNPILLPSEKAFGYKLRMEKMKQRPGRSKKDSQLGNQSRGTKSSESLSKQVDESKSQIYRYIRLTNLHKEILDMVDEKIIPFNIGVEISYLDDIKQIWMLEYIKEGTKPDLEQMQTIRETDKKHKLTKAAMKQIMKEGKLKKEVLRIPIKKLSSYFPPDYSHKQMLEDIFIILGNIRNKRAE